jgi:hypothetical protein
VLTSTQQSWANNRDPNETLKWRTGIHKAEIWWQGSVPWKGSSKVATGFGFVEEVKTPSLIQSACSNHLLAPAVSDEAVTPLQNCKSSFKDEADSLELDVNVR